MCKMPGQVWGRAVALRCSGASCFSRRAQEIKGTLKSHREVIHHLFVGNSPPNQIPLKLADVFVMIGTGSKNYGGSNFGLLHMNGLSPITL